MSARAAALLAAQLRAYGGKSVQNAGDGYNVYDSTGALIQSSIRSEYPEGEEGDLAMRLDHLELLRQVLLVERQASSRYVLVGADKDVWCDIWDTEEDRTVATCLRSDAEVIIAGLLDHDITSED